MGNVLYFLLFILGLAMIIKGSDWFIDSVIWVSKVFKIPYIIIGATIVSICTTMPETFVSLAASIRGETSVAFGNAVGSIAINTGVIMGILLLFGTPVIENRKAYARNGGILLGVLFFCLFAGILVGEFTRVIGVALLVMLVIYLYTNYKQAKAMMMLDATEYDIEDRLDPTDTEFVAEGAVVDKEEGDIDISKMTITKMIFFFIVGITAVIIGSALLVDNGILIAEILGVPSIVIAITFTALGTSLPELVTTISSIRKGVTNLGVGNIIGANILNVVQVLGISSVVTPISMKTDSTLLTFQLPAVIIIVGCAVVFGLTAKEGFKRWQGVVLLLIYSVFLTFNLMRENTPILGDLFF